MKTCIIIGNPNVGKTSFFLSLAEYLGVNRCEVEITDIYGKVLVKNISVNFARKYLVSTSPFKTRNVYKMKLTIPVYKGYEQLILVDTAGVTDGINEVEEIRKSMAQTLKELSQAKIILHMFDAQYIYYKKEGGISEIDYQIKEFGSQQGCYCILVNKMDKDNSQKGLDIIRDKFKENYIIPISTVDRTGFKEVKAFVGRNL
ncbi:50S ribosome-binding GTPase [Alkaliphilus sp. MSJ-5]|uniref:50S ribosome-binding GTPase n=1 Tax=Alkaliphilus flagellatus TaxID=2841507 RepID=A0ABS6G701_9FIRM|nr:GTPase domain-containing protein [Alkaliphilus flagellatus]MBU5677492.1 50S ribosome-binding GTPase [Alkaliphilus flagellatus]